MTFSASDAAFEGFRLVRRKPMVILWWSLAYLAFFLLLIATVGPSFLALMPQLEAISDVARPTPEQFGPILQTYGLIFLIAVPISIIMSAVLSTAVARAVLAPEDGRFGYMRLGMDEVRVGVVTLALGLLLLVAYVAAALLIGVLTFVGSLVNGGVAILMAIIGVLLVLAALVWIAVRLSLAVPITYAEKRIAIFDSFQTTKGRFWPLLGMAVIAVMMTILVSLLGMIIGLPFQLMGGAAFEAAIQSGETEAVIAALGPMVIVGLLLNLVLSSLQLAVLYAPFSAAYRDLKGR